MTEAFAHKRPHNRVIDFAKKRRYEIRKEIEWLTAEDGMWKHVLEVFAPLVCDYCDGEGAGLFGGDNIDGPRMATCPKCKGTGVPG